jgi:hypothetical protein
MVQCRKTEKIVNNELKTMSKKIAVAYPANLGYYFNRSLLDRKKLTKFT